MLAGLTSPGGLADWLEVIPSAAGLHLCTLLRDPVLDDVSIAEAALAAGVFVEPLSVRHLEQPPRHGLAFGVGGIPLERIGPALAALRQVLSASRPARRVDG